jgi:hypothetical protein
LFFVVTPEYLGGKTDSFQTFFAVGGNKFMFNHGKVSLPLDDSLPLPTHSILTPNLPPPR